MVDGRSQIATPKAPITQRQAARILGVHFQHLNRVLLGQRESKRLMRLYNDLIDRVQRPTETGSANTVSAPDTDHAAESNPTPAN